MWVRKRIDIGVGDLAFALAKCITSANGNACAERIERKFENDGAHALTTFSVRSGFDLLLTELAWPAGTEVLVSALTIRDMIRILEEHGLVPIPVDLDPDTMAPTLESLERAVSPATRGILVAHLFGSRIDLEPIADWAHRRRLTLFEDCAQAFVGLDFTGHADADVTMFSFGTIKTCTALGGGVLVSRDPSLIEKMRRTQSTWPTQSRWTFAKRVLKYSLFVALSLRWTYALSIRVLKWWGVDPDNFVNHAVKGFPGADFFRRIRQRPCGPLLALLDRRLEQFRPSRLARRAMLGERLAKAIASHVDWPGSRAGHRTHWVFPALAENPKRTCEALWKAGFDATQGDSLVVVAAPSDREELAAKNAAILLKKIVYAPLYPQLSEAAVDRMAQALRADCARAEHGWGFESADEDGANAQPAVAHR